MRKVALRLVITVLLSLLARSAGAQIYYLMPGDLTCATTNTVACQQKFAMANSVFNGVTVNGRSRWPYIYLFSAYNAYQGGAFDNSLNYDAGMMFTVYPEFVPPNDTTTYPTVKIRERRVYFSIDVDAGALANQYVCWKYRYRWVNAGATADFGNANFRVPSNWRTDACINITNEVARTMLTWRNTEVIDVYDAATNARCFLSGTRCPRGMLISQIYRIRANDVCVGSGSPLPCCDGPGSGTCCDGPANSDTTCSGAPTTLRVWAAKLVVDGGL